LIKVLIIDDSATVRKVVTKELSKDPEIEIVGSAPDPYMGRDKIVRLSPDILILDIELPKMNGLTFLKKLMKAQPMPVIILSSFTDSNPELIKTALKYGATEVVCKTYPDSSFEKTCEILKEKIKNIDRNQILKKSKSNKGISTNIIRKKRNSNFIVAIGASTGGTHALYNLLTKLPEEIPPILIVQHMPQYFTSTFAERLNNSCKFYVHEAFDGEPLSPGKVLLAPGNKHMVLKKKGMDYSVDINDGPRIFHQRPSIEILFNSVAKYAGRNSIGVLLTGMGKDGARGLLNMKNAGALTVAQNEESCVVFGMPKEAISIGAAKKVMHIDDIYNIIINPEKYYE